MLGGLLIPRRLAAFLHRDSHFPKATDAIGMSHHRRVGRAHRYYESCGVHRAPRADHDDNRALCPRNTSALASASAFLIGPSNIKFPELMFDGDCRRKFNFSSEPVCAHWALL
jgi:hypothetical protein